MRDAVSNGSSACRGLCVQRRGMFSLTLARGPVVNEINPVIGLGQGHAAVSLAVGSHGAAAVDAVRLGLPLDLEVPGRGRGCKDSGGRGDEGSEVADEHIEVRGDMGGKILKCRNCSGPLKIQ